MELHRFLHEEEVGTVVNDLNVKRERESRRLFQAGASALYLQASVVCTTLTKNLLSWDIVNTSARSVDESNGNVIGNVLDPRLIHLNDRILRPAIPRSQGLKPDVPTKNEMILTGFLKNVMIYLAG